MTVLDIIEQKQPIKHKLFKNVYAVGELDNTQKSVINASEDCNMVAVTGCFGTGKSHVITNLASHYLINGKKVLIVAKNDNALGVIYDRLVEIGGDYVAMRCGNRDKQVDLALKLSNLVSNQVNFSHEYASKLSYWLAKDKKQECKKLMKTADTILSALNLTRVFCRPTPNLEDSTIYRITARYRAVVDKKNNIYRR